VENGGFLERENPLLGFHRMYETGLLRLCGISPQGKALLGDCRHSMQEDTQFRMGMPGLQGLCGLWSQLLKPIETSSVEKAIIFQDKQNTALVLSIYQISETSHIREVKEA
jgi:hypothetical protein